MNTPFLYCDCCGKAIHYGKPYVCISHSVEVAEHSLVKNQDEADVIESHSILVLCRSCGNHYNENFFELVVNAIPYKLTRVCEN